MGASRKLQGEIEIDRVLKTGGGGSEAMSLGARMFPSAAAASGTQWRPQTLGVTFPTQSETGQGRPEIAPDHREKFLQRLQQVGQQQHQVQQQQLQQQQGDANMVTMPSNLSAAHPKPFPSTSQDEQNLLMLQADLKEEIQKLRRSRNQLKTWVQSWKIKDGKVGDLGSQIDNFEAEVEGLSIKQGKGKARPPRLTHLEMSITRDKAHIKKLESILRPLANDELSPEQVNNVKDFPEDCVERNQDDCDDFSDVELYTMLPLEKVEALEDMVSLGPSTLAKATAPSAAPQPPCLDPLEETVSQESNSDVLPRTPPSRTGPVSIPSPATTPLPTNPSPCPLAGGPTAASVVFGPAFSRTASDSGSAAAPSVTANVPAAAKKNDPANLPGRRPSPAIPAQNRPVQVSVPQVAAQLPVIGLVTSGMVGSVPMKSIVAGDDRAVGGNVTQPLRSPVGNCPMLQQQLNEAGGGGSEAMSLGARMFPSAAAASGTQWRPQTPGVTFPTQSETGQRRPEIAPDHREKFLQRLQQVGQQQQQVQQQQLQQQQDDANMVTMPSNLSAANQKPFPSTSQEEQNLLMLRADLKEEIQKLRRSRNQLKTWVQSWKIMDGKFVSPPGPSRRNEPETSVFTEK